MIATNLKKKKMTIISPTAGSLLQFSKCGLLGRQLLLINEYAKRFTIDYYSSDTESYSDILNNEQHRFPKVSLKKYGLRHLVFYLYLILCARKMSGIIRVLGPALPVLPIIKILSRSFIIISFNYDWAKTNQLNYSGLKKILSYWIQTVSLRSADLVVCTTKELQNSISEVFDKKTIIVPNFVDLSIFKPSEKISNMIIYAGRLHWSKGVKNLISAFNGIKDKNARLIICGDGEEKNALQMNAINDKRVLFKGVIRQEELANLMGKSGIFVLPSLTSEGHPKALIEAMATKNACVVSNVPGNKELIIDGKTGRLFEPSKPVELKNIIEELMNDGKKRTLLQEAAYKESRKFGIENTVSFEIDKIQEILNWRDQN
jgi:glycosyltransferase involved in cell wall biosynthesis